MEPIEPRLFSETFRNWAGEALDSYQKLLRFIRSTRTQTGLCVTAYLDRRDYPVGAEPSSEELEALRLKPHKVLPKWNYTISPNPCVSPKPVTSNRGDSPAGPRNHYLQREPGASAPRHAALRKTISQKHRNITEDSDQDLDATSPCDLGAPLEQLVPHWNNWSHRGYSEKAFPHRGVCVSGAPQFRELVKSGRCLNRRVMRSTFPSLHFGLTP